jgi:hypothetical protein
VPSLAGFGTCQLAAKELQRYDDYRDSREKGAISKFGRFILAAFIVRHSATRHQSNAVNSMNPFASFFHLQGQRSARRVWREPRWHQDQRGVSQRFVPQVYALGRATRDRQSLIY